MSDSLPPSAGRRLLRLFVVVVGRWVLLIALGMLLFMSGLATLGVPADLAIWRHIVGGILLSVAALCWMLAAIL